MSTQDQARALMMRHHQMIKNRQQSMLRRTAAEVGMTAGDEYQNRIQGKFPADFAADYDRNGGSVS
ncbi:MAG: hypothetical protein MUF72_09720 [Elainella sp. Prado103]|jgi:hypothetical protein|nr:hypothetical protein [Elainella sp. Prado103]